MPSPTPPALPGRTFQSSRLNSRLAFHWRSRDLDLTTVKGDAGTFARSSPGGMVLGRGGRTWLDDNRLRLVGPAADDLERYEMALNADGIFVPALRLEGARTNGYTRSEEFDDAAWTKINGSASADAIAAPDGSVTADKFVEASDSNLIHRIQQTTPASSVDTDQSVSVYAKAGERTFLAIRAVDKNNDETRSFFDLGNGALGTVDAGHTATIEDVGDGWNRCTVVFDSDSGGTTLVVRFELAISDGDVTYDGDGTSGLFLWGAQFEADQPFASSYIPTVGSTVTRNAETLSFPFNLDPTEMTVYAKFIEAGTLSVVNARLLGITTSGLATANLNVFMSSGNYRLLHDSSSGAVSSTMSVAPSIGDLVELRMALASSGAVQIHQAINGGAEVSATASAASALDTAWSSPLFFVGSVGNNRGYNKFLEVKVAVGTKTMREIREAA